jgi:predicted nuclease with TOPRIM domain
LSVLTKIFVVLVTFLSIFLVALIVPFVAKTENYRAQVEHQKLLTESAKAAADEKQSEITRLEAGESERFINLQGEKRRLTDQITTLTEQVATANAQTRKLETDSAKRDADMRALTAAAEQYGVITQTLQDELQQRRSDSVRSQTRIIELDDRNNELESQLASLERRVRQFTERNTELESELQTLEQGVAQLPDAQKQMVFGRAQDTEAQPFVASQPIQGLVTHVEPLLDDVYVQLDVGRNDGVQENMKFMVHRGGQFIGNAIVVRVETDESAAKLRNVQGGMQVTVGDAALSAALQSGSGM